MAEGISRAKLQRWVIIQDIQWGRGVWCEWRRLDVRGWSLKKVGGEKQETRLEQMEQCPVRQAKDVGSYWIEATGSHSRSGET